jgi:hypothetical protein
MKISAFVLRAGVVVGRAAGLDVSLAGVGAVPGSKS